MIAGGVDGLAASSLSIQVVGGWSVLWTWQGISLFPHRIAPTAGGIAFDGCVSDDRVMKPDAVAIIPCSDLDTSLAFYERLGFVITADYPHHGYRILHDRAGASLHLTRAPDGWLIPERNPNGVYLYTERVTELAATFGASADPKPWGLIEFAVSDPDGTLVRIGWEAGAGSE